MGDKEIWFSYLHVVHEQGMISSSWDDTDFDSVFGVPIQKLIIHKYLYTESHTLLPVNLGAIVII